MTDTRISTKANKKDLLLTDEAGIANIKKDSSDYPSWSLTTSQLCDIELLLNGAYSPLTGFMCKADYESVCNDMKLADGRFWPLPICLDVNEQTVGKLTIGDSLALRDGEGFMLAILTVEEIWKTDLKTELEAIAKSVDIADPVDSEPATETWYVGGNIAGISLPLHYDFRDIRLTPDDLKRRYAKLGWRRIAGYHATGFIHRAEHRLTTQMARQLEASLLLLPAVGNHSSEDREHYTRIRSYQEILNHYPRNTALLTLNPMSTDMSGPRAVLLQAIIHKNYGCTHFIYKDDESGSHSSDDRSSTDSSAKLLERYAAEIGIEPVIAKPLIYVEDLDAYRPLDEVPEGARTLSLSDSDLKLRLNRGRDIPGWFSYPEVVAELRKAFPPRHKQGFTVFFTGLSGSGKSTVANVLLVKLMEIGGRPVTLLDGDIVRQNLSSNLGFSKKDRNINIRRIGFVASEITKNGGIAICAPIAPYEKVRTEVRQDVERGGGFILIHVSTPLEVCEVRDRKGLYALARAGKIKEFTGISDPYEEPADADILLDTTDIKPEEAAQEIIIHLEHLGYIASNGNGPSR